MTTTNTYYASSFIRIWETIPVRQTSSWTFVAIVSVYTRETRNEGYVIS